MPVNRASCSWTDAWVTFKWQKRSPAAFHDKSALKTTQHFKSSSMTVGHTAGDVEANGTRQPLRKMYVRLLSCISRHLTARLLRRHSTPFQLSAARREQLLSGWCGLGRRVPGATTLRVVLSLNASTVDASSLSFGASSADRRSPTDKTHTWFRSSLNGCPKWWTCLSDLSNLTGTVLKEPRFFYHARWLRANCTTSWPTTSSG